MFDFAELIGRTRRVVHGVFAVAANYVDDTMAAPVALRVRWHYKQQPIGDLENGGYAVIVDNIEKAIFNRDELSAKTVTIRPGGRLTITAPGFEAVLAIDSKDDVNGPVDESWRVGKFHDGLAP